MSSATYKIARSSSANKRDITTSSLKPTDKYLHGPVGVKHETVPLKCEAGQVISATMTTHPGKHHKSAALEIGYTKEGKTQYAVIKEENLVDFTTRVSSGHVLPNASTVVHKHFQDNPTVSVDILKEDKSKTPVQLKDIYDPKLAQTFTDKSDAISALNKNNILSSNLPSSNFGSSGGVI